MCPEGHSARSSEEGEDNCGEMARAEQALLTHRHSHPGPGRAATNRCTVHGPPGSPGTGTWSAS